MKPVYPTHGKMLTTHTGTHASAASGHDCHERRWGGEGSRTAVVFPACILRTTMTHENILCATSLVCNL